MKAKFIGGRLCEVAYTNPQLLNIYFTPIKGIVWALMPLSYVSDSSAARICQRVQSEGAKRRSGGGGGGWPRLGFLLLKIRV